MIESPCSRDSDDLDEQDDNQLSPCTFQCRLVKNDTLELCASCGRTRQEIVNWTKYSLYKQKDIIETLPGRLKNLAKI